MNITFLSLQISILSNSPLISNSYSFQSSTFKLSQSSFNHFFSPCFFGLINKNKFYIKDSQFNNFLDSAIKIDQTYVTNVNVRFDRVSVYDTTFKCKDSKFKDCQCVYGQGGAIFSLSSTILRNCYFARCQSELGGGIYSASDIDYFSTTFHDCIGYKEGGSVFADHPTRVSVSFCTFSKSTSTYAGALAVEHPPVSGQAILRYNNFSLCGSILSVGALHISKLNTDIQYSICDQCFSSLSTGGAKLHCCNGFFLSSNIFILCSAGQAQENEGAVLTLYQPVKDGLISYCSFARTKKLSGLTIYVEFDEIPDQPPPIISIQNCCFAYDQYIEYNTSLVTDDNSSVYKHQCDTYVLFVLPRRIGNSYNESPTPPPRLFNKIITHSIINFISAYSSIAIMTGVVFGVLLWIISFFILRRHQYRRGRRVKRGKFHQLL